ncbi:MAG: HAMP domain-containing sensor histidine kinase [Betaproteobacteria bacterium]
MRELPSAASLDVPTLNDHIPALLDELVRAFRVDSDQTIAGALNAGSSPAHGLQRLKDAYDIEEVVAEYNILRGCIHDLADENGLVLQGKPFQILNRIFDGAIGVALQTYASERASAIKERREQYLAFVAHDLRTPLNAISLAGRVLEMLIPESRANVDIAKMFKALRRNVQHLEALIARVLEENANIDTAGGLKLERRTFDLWPLVESLIHELHPVSAGQAGPTRLMNDVPEDLQVYADAGLVRRILQNLVSNALKYTPSGEVRIAAAEREDRTVDCWVRDTGTGIDEAFLGKVFDKGETNPEVTGGTGLGLAIVKAFTEAHGGSVAVESEEGVGSTFRFSLPPKDSATAI